MALTDQQGPERIENILFVINYEYACHVDDLKPDPIRS